jgi:hypothetical protein
MMWLPEAYAASHGGNTDDYLEGLRANVDPEALFATIASVYFVAVL